MGLLMLMMAMAGLPPQEVAAIERDQEQARLAVAAKYGNRKLNELSADERRAQAKDWAEAQGRVLEQHNVQPHDWALTKARQSRAGRDAAAQAALALDLAEQERSKAEALEKAQAAEERLVIVQRGVSEENAVILEEIDNGVVAVERGLPEDAKADQALAVEQDRLAGLRAPVADSRRPTPGTAKGQAEGRGKPRR